MTDMPYLVDGHNLIPKVGLRLDSIDDEMELVAILQEFSRLHRKQVEVYFDGAPAGQAGTRSLGTVKAHFVRAGTTADTAIARRLKKWGTPPKTGPWSAPTGKYKPKRGPLMPKYSRRRSLPVCCNKLHAAKPVNLS